MVSELRSETATLETALTAERFRVERMMSEMAKKDEKILEQGDAIRKMAEMAQKVSNLIDKQIVSISLYFELLYFEPL